MALNSLRNCRFCLLLQEGTEPPRPGLPSKGLGGKGCLGLREGLGALSARGVVIRSNRLLE